MTQTQRNLTQELADTRELLASLARVVEHMARRELRRGEEPIDRQPMNVNREEIWDGILYAQQVRDAIAPKRLAASD